MSDKGFGGDYDFHAAKIDNVKLFPLATALFLLYLAVVAGAIALAALVIWKLLSY